MMDAGIVEKDATRGKILQMYKDAYKNKISRELTNHGKNTNIPEKKSGPGNENTGRSQASSTFSAYPHTRNRLRCFFDIYKNNETDFSDTDNGVNNILNTQNAIAPGNQDLIVEMENYLFKTINALASTLDEKDPYTLCHSQRVGETAILIGRQLGLGTDALGLLALAGNLHDIGKIGIPGEILQKSSELTRDEYVIIKTHPEKGANILKRIGRMRPIVDAVYTHHEWYNGMGYPQGLSGEDIPFFGAIISVADAWDSITSERIYCRKRSYDEACKILKECSGTQFHPRVVRAALDAKL